MQKLEEKSDSHILENVFWFWFFSTKSMWMTKGEECLYRGHHFYPITRNNLGQSSPVRPINSPCHWHGKGRPGLFPPNCLLSSQSEWKEKQIQTPCTVTSSLTASGATKTEGLRSCPHQETKEAWCPNPTGIATESSSREKVLAAQLRKWGWVVDWTILSPCFKTMPM